MDWNPDQYLKFKIERTQPSIDLVNRISLDNPETIIDIGCGPGNSTRILCRRWPNADILGLDNSSHMIEKARQDFPDMKWVVQDAANYTTNQLFDLVFSNATLQWIHHHEILIPHLFSLVNHNGVLAVQVPANNDSPMHIKLLEVSANKRWKEYTAGCGNLLIYHNADFYYHLLMQLKAKIEIWETTYFHILDSPESLIEWYSSTGMKPFLDRLPNEEAKTDFQNEILNDIRVSYPLQPDGKIIFPFKRLFFTAVKT